MSVCTESGLAKLEFLRLAKGTPLSERLAKGTPLSVWGLVFGTRNSCVSAVPMAGFEGEEHLEVAGGLRSVIVETGGLSNPRNEFRRRLAAAGIKVSATVCSRLWRAAGEQLVVASQDAGSEEVEEHEDEEEDAEEQGLTLIELKLSCLTTIREEETLDDYEERLA